MAPEDHDIASGGSPAPVIRVLAQGTRGAAPAPVELDELPTVRAEGRWVWVDLVAPDGDTLAWLAVEFGLDAMVVEDVLDIELLPQIEDYGDHLYVVLHGLVAVGDRVDTQEIDTIVEDGVLITIHDVALPGIDAVWRLAQRHPDAILDADAGVVFARLAEIVGRRFLEVILELDRRIEDLAERAIDADPGVIVEVQALRREAATLRTMLRPQRQALGSLAAVDSPILSERARRRCMDAADIHTQVVESLDTSRSLLGDVLDTYRGAASEELAQVTRVLTVYAAVLLPLSLIAGFFGMNFADLPLLDTDWGWLVVTGGMVAFAVASWLVFARRGFTRGTGLREVSHRLGKGLASAVRAPVRVVGTVGPRGSTRRR